MRLISSTLTSVPTLCMARPCGLEQDSLKQGKGMGRASALPYLKYELCEMWEEEKGLARWDVFDLWDHRIEKYARRVGPKRHHV